MSSSTTYGWSDFVYDLKRTNLLVRKRDNTLVVSRHLGRDLEEACGEFKIEGDEVIATVPPEVMTEAMESFLGSLLLDPNRTIALKRVDEFSRVTLPRGQYVPGPYYDI